MILPANGAQLRVVPATDLKVIDPFQTTAMASKMHSALVYDQLFGWDDKMAAQPQMIEAYSKGDNEIAQDIHHGLLPVIKALMTTAANPVPVKSALNAMGFNAGPFRLPLVPLTAEQLKSVMKTIHDAGEYITFAKTGVKVA